MDSDEIQLLLDQARITLNKGRLREANKFLDKVLKHNPDDDQALNLKGLLLFKEDKYAEATEVFRRLLELFPNEATLLTNLGLALLKSEQLVEAETHLQKALEADGNPEKIHNYLGLVMSGLGRYHAAQEHFEKAGSKKMAEQMLSLMESDVEDDSTYSDVDDDHSVHQQVAMAAAETLENSISQEIEAHEQTLNAKSPVIDPDDSIDDDSIIEGDPLPPLPGLQSLGSQDVLSVALHALQERFGGVMETQDYGRNLQKLSEMLSVYKKPEQSYESPLPNVARIDVDADPSYARSSLIVASNGPLTASIQNKKYKGKELSTPFGSETDPFHRIEGKGHILLEAQAKKWFHIIPIEEELIYLVDKFVAAFIGELRFENGRLPSDDGYDVDLVQFRGTGRIFIQSDEKLLTVPVQGDDKCAFSYDKVVGWFGNTVPSLAANRPPFSAKVPKLISFKGKGVVLSSCTSP